MEVRERRKKGNERLTRKDRRKRRRSRGNERQYRRRGTRRGEWEED